MKKVAIETLGCKLNQAESEELAVKLAKAGCSIVNTDDGVDIYILNTCTVTHIADRKTRHLLRMARRCNPGAVIIAIGCYPQRNRQELAAIDGVDMVLDNDEKLELIERLAGGGYLPEMLPPDADFCGLRSRSFVRAQQGCSNFCAYCIVPSVRGREKSLPPDEVVSAVKDRQGRGYREVVLTGTEIGSYNYKGIDITGLIEAILNRTSIERLRLSSLQPSHITPQLVELWRNERLCPHFHLSLQSGSNGVLARMKRRYRAEDYNRAVALIRSIVPDVAITTDIIVGFPGESNIEFEESYNFCQCMRFARIHVFPYSSRPGTEAAGMKGQVSAVVKKERSRRMLVLAEESARSFRQGFTGETMPVLWEQRNKGVWSGLTGNYIRVYIRSEEDLTGCITAVKLEKLWRDGVWGAIASTPR